MVVEASGRAPAAPEGARILTLTVDPADSGRTYRVDVAGFGDVKLAGVLGMYLGYLSWGHLFAGTFLAFLLGGLWSLALLAARRGTLKSSIPFGPFMLAGAAAAMLLPA